MSDRTRLVVENYLLRLLMDLPPDCPPMTVTQARGGLAVVLRVGPTGELSGPATLSARDREILEGARAVIAQAGRRVQGAEIRTALKRAGVRWGESTINRTLADLVAARHLANDRDGRGYGLPGDDPWGPDATPG